MAGSGVVACLGLLFNLDLARWVDVCGRRLSHAGRWASLGRRLGPLVRALSIRQRRRPAGLALLVAGLSWLIDAAVLYLLTAALGLGLSSLAVLVIAALTVLATAVPSGPGFIGTFELAAVTAGVAVGLQPSAALALAVLAHLATLGPISLLGAAFAVRRSWRGRAASA